MPRATCHAAAGQAEPFRMCLKVVDETLVETDWPSLGKDFRSRDLDTI